MTYYAVIDTNVVISSMQKHSSVPGQVMDLAVAGAIVPLLNDEILTEYKGVLSRNNFGFEESVINDLIDLLKETGIFLERTATKEDFPNSDDAVFYEIVMTARNTENAFLITGNIKHFPAKPFVVTPREMLDIIQNSEM